MRQDVREAIESACGVEPRGRAEPHMPENTVLADWRTFEPARRKSVTTLRRQVLAMLRELPEDMTVAELRDELDG